MSAPTGFPDRAAALSLDLSWIHGSEAAKYNNDPDIQVHACDEHTYILRQNMAVHFEAPFMFLLFGRSRALLLDTGATASPRFFPLRRTVDAIIDGWLASHPHADGYEAAGGTSRPAGRWNGRSPSHARTVREHDPARIAPDRVIRPRTAGSSA